MKGFPIAEWQKAKRKPKPIELPPMEDDVDDVIVDKHSRESVRDEIARSAGREATLVVDLRALHLHQTAIPSLTAALFPLDLP